MTLAAVTCARGTVATAPRQQGTPAPGPVVEIRDAATGVVDGSVTRGGTVRAAAMTPPSLELLVGSRILRYHAASGTPLGTTTVPAGVAADLDASGSWIAFRRAASASALDVQAGRITTIATAPRHPSGVALDAHPLVWTESRRIAAGAVSKRTCESRIRTPALPSP